MFLLRRKTENEGKLENKSKDQLTPSCPKHTKRLGHLNFTLVLLFVYLSPAYLF